MRERLRTIGQAFRAPAQTAPIIETKQAEVKEKDATVGLFVDFLRSNDSLSSEKKLSDKVLLANKGWVYRNNDVLAREVSKIEFELFSIRTVGNKIQYTPLESHPILDALDRFNEFTSASDGFYTTQSHRKLTGDAFWYIDGAGTNVNGIYILPPDKITVNIGEVSGNQRVITSYVYEDSIDGKKVHEEYEPEDIIHFKVPNPRRYFRGLGIVEAIADDIDLDFLATDATKKLFQRGMINNFALSTDARLSDDQIRSLRAQLTSSYSGIENAFKVPILTSGLSPTTIQATNRDMQFNELMQWTRDKIMVAFGNTPAVLGIIEDVNRANSESTIDNWRETTVRSELKQVCDTLNEFFVPRFGTNLLLGFKDLADQDEDEMINNVVQLIGSNVITANEAREMLGYQPIDGGEGLRESLGLPIVPAVPKALEHINLKAALRKSDVYGEIEIYKKVKQVTDNVARNYIKSRAKPKAQKVEVNKIDDYYAKQMRIVDHYENIFKNKIVQFVNKLVEKALANVPAEMEKSQNKQLFDDEGEVVQATIDFTPILTEVSTVAGIEALKLVGDKGTYIMSDISRKKLEDRIKLFATSLVDTDKQKLLDIIEQGVKNGESVPQIKNQIVDTFGEYSKTQAERITRTEVLRAANQSSLDAWEQSDVVTGKQWLAAPDADEVCSQYDGQVVEDLQGNFFDPQSEFEDGDPPIHPNCRCVVIPVVTNKSFDKDGFKFDGLKKRIAELEAQADKRKKAFKQLKAEKLEDNEYIERLEKYLDEKA